MTDGELEDLQEDRQEDRQEDERCRRIRAGDRRALATLLRELDDGDSRGRRTLAALRGAANVASTADLAAARAGGRMEPRGFTVGVTGGPGAGKSTLVDALTAHWRTAGVRVGVVAVDPSNTLRGGGAVLGDRVRMQRHAIDSGVFIRSVATRGAAGGLSRSALDIAAALSLSGYPRVLVETVGVGQSEIDIAGGADVTVVVMTPGLGDDVQTLKAGVLEVADILVLNKADQPGAEATVRDLQAMLALRAMTRPGAAADEVSILSTVATTGQGLAALAAAVEKLADKRLELDSEAAEKEARVRMRAGARLRAAATARFDAALRDALAPGGWGADLVGDLAGQRVDLDRALDVLMERFGKGY